MVSASSEDKKSLRAASRNADTEPKEEEKPEEEVRQKLPPELAGLAANIAASPNQLLWQVSVSDADAQVLEAKIGAGMPPATTGVDAVDAALNVLEAAGVMSLAQAQGQSAGQDAAAAKIAAFDERLAAQSLSLGAEAGSLQNMLMAAKQLNAPAVAVPAATPANAAFSLDAALPAVRVQLLETAEEGGSHAVLKTVPGDGSALGIDLKLDGQGNATLVLNVANDAEHMRLQQTLSSLHAGFAAMGLALNVELRQGDDSSEQAPTPDNGRRATMVRAVAEAPAAPASRMQITELAGAGSQIHFYA